MDFSRFFRSKSTRANQIRIVGISLPTGAQKAPAGLPLAPLRAWGSYLQACRLY